MADALARASLLEMFPRAGTMGSSMPSSRWLVVATSAGKIKCGATLAALAENASKVLHSPLEIQKQATVSERITTVSERM